MVRRAVDFAQALANIAHLVPLLKALPRYLVPGERGAGFAQVATAILEAKAARQ